MSINCVGRTTLKPQLASLLSAVGKEVSTVEADAENRVKQAEARLEQYQEIAAERESQLGRQLRELQRALADTQTNLQIERGLHLRAEEKNKIKDKLIENLTNQLSEERSKYGELEYRFSLVNEERAKREQEIIEKEVKHQQQSQ